MEPGNNTNTSFELGKSGSAASGGSLLNRSWGLGLARTVQKRGYGELLEGLYRAKQVYYRRCAQINKRLTRTHSM